MKSRVNRGQVRICNGVPYIVLRIERGRVGEDRTMYVLGRESAVADGVTVPCETRGHHVREWPCVGRVRLSFRETDALGVISYYHTERR